LGTPTYSFSPSSCESRGASRPGLVRSTRAPTGSSTSLAPPRASSGRSDDSAPAPPPSTGEGGAEGARPQGRARWADIPPAFHPSATMSEMRRGVYTPSPQHPAPTPVPTNGPGGECGWPSPSTQCRTGSNAPGTRGGERRPLWGPSFSRDPCVGRLGRCVVGRAIFDPLLADLGAPASRDQQVADQEIAAQSCLVSASGDSDSSAAGRVNVDDDALASAVLSAAPLAAGALARVRHVARLLPSSSVLRTVAAPKDGQLTQPTNPHNHIGCGINLTGVGQVSPDIVGALPSPTDLRPSAPTGREGSFRGGSGTSGPHSAEADKQQNHMGHPRGTPVYHGK
jgi:hypothetical protein